MAVSIKSAAQLIDVDHSKAIFLGDYINVRSAVKVVTPPYNVVNLVNDVGGRVGRVVVVVDGYVHLVADVRHSRDFTFDDLTVYSITTTSPTEVLKYDYGSVINAKEMLIKVSLWSSTTAYAVNAAVDVSPDDVTYTRVASWSTNSTSEVMFLISTQSYSFRYLSFKLWANGGGVTVGSRLRKVVIIV